MKFDHTKVTFGGHIQEHVRTADGNRVILLAVVHLNGRDMIVGVVRPATERSWITTWDLNGTAACTTDYNLNMTGPKRKLSGWLTIYPDGYISGKLYGSKGEAIRYGTPTAVARVHREIEFEEGEGL